MLRWIKRIAFGLVALVALAVVGGIAFFNTDYGRDKLRGELVSKLNDTFAFGATVGRVEGSPFGELTLYEVVINGPDGKPAIMVGTLRLRLRLIDLMSKDVRLGEVLAEDVDIQLRRDKEGRTTWSQLLKRNVQATDPPPPPTQRTWNIDLPAIELRRAHLVIDTGTQDLESVNLDGLAATGSIHIPAQGDRTFELAIAATWRERDGAPIALQASVRDTVDMLSVPTLSVRVGGVAVSAAKVEIVMRAGQLPLIGGSVQVTAPAAAVNALVPRIMLAQDVVASLTTTRGAMSTIGLHGTIGPTTIRADLVADLDREHAIGKLVTGDLDLTTLTRGRVVAVVGGTFDFDLLPGATGALPTATVAVVGRGTFEDLPHTEFTGKVATAGQRISTQLDISGPGQVAIVADLVRSAEDSLVLERGSIVGSVSDVTRASGGRIHLRGAVAVDLTGHGRLTPTPDLAVAGTITGAHLGVQDVSVVSARITLDARDLLRHPHGTARAQLVGLVRGPTKFGALDVTAATRSDDRIAVQIVSHPLQAPWLVELAALVTPPANDGTIVVDLGHHHVRAGTGTNWLGDAGRIVIGPERIDVRGVSSASADGKLAASGSYMRAGRRTGDLTAKVELETFALAALDRGYTGTVDAKLAATRASGLWSGDAELTGTAVVIAADKPPIDLTARIAAKPGSVTVAATASSKGFGSAKLALDLEAPMRLDDATAWKHRGRTAIRSAQLALHGVDLGHVARLAHQDVAGQLDGEIDLTATSITGALHVVNLQTSAMRGVRSANIDLELGQTRPDEVDPKLTVAFAEIGKIVATAQIGLPEHVLDPAAWTHLGLDALRGLQIQTDRIAIDPALLDRFQIASTLRAKATLRAEIGAGARTITVTGDLTDVRTAQLAQPVNMHVVGGFDNKVATVKLALTTTDKKKASVTLLQLDGRMPVTVDQLRGDPAAIATLPLTATIELVKTSAPQLLAVFGRTEVTAGTLDGKVDVAGTIAKPTLHAHLVAAGLEMPPGPGGKPVQKIQQLALDAAWADGNGTLAIDGTEQGGGTLTVRAQGTPGNLAAGSATIVSKNFDASPLLVFAPGPAGGSRGSLDANLSIKGFDLRTTQLLGEIHIVDARIPIAPTIGTLRKANIDIVVREHDLDITTTGKLGAGDVKLIGSIALDGASLTGGKATLTLRKVSPIGSVEPIIDADVAATLARKDNVWTADLVVDHGFIKIGTTKGEKLKGVGTPPDLVVGRGKPPPKAKGPGQAPEDPALVANITLHDAKVESGEFRTTIHGTLIATADARTVGLVGTIESVGGDVDLFDRRYKIETAAVHFDGTTDPLLDVRITHDFPDVETITEVRGRLSKPELRLAADPGQYTEGQLLGFLLGGEPTGDPKSSSAQDKATGAGASLIAGRLAGYVKKALPFDIDVIRYEAATIDRGSAITVGSWVTHTLFFAFRQHLESRPDQNSGEATAEYWLTKRLEVEATAGDRGYDGIDLLWRKRF